MPPHPPPYSISHPYITKPSDSSERLVLEIYSDEFGGAEGKQKVWFRLKGARADATSTILTDLQMNGKCCDNSFGKNVLKGERGFSTWDKYCKLNSINTHYSVN